MQALDQERGISQLLAACGAAWTNADVGRYWEGVQSNANENLSDRKMRHF